MATAAQPTGSVSNQPPKTVRGGGQPCGFIRGSVRASGNEQIDSIGPGACPACRSGSDLGRLGGCPRLSGLSAAPPCPGAPHASSLPSSRATESPRPGSEAGCAGHTTDPNTGNRPTEARDPAHPAHGRRSEAADPNRPTKAGCSPHSRKNGSPPGRNHAPPGAHTPGAIRCCGVRGTSHRAGADRQHTRRLRGRSCCVSAPRPQTTLLPNQPTQRVTRECRANRDGTAGGPAGRIGPHARLRHPEGSAPPTVDRMGAGMSAHAPGPTHGIRPAPTGTRTGRSTRPTGPHQTTRHRGTPHAGQQDKQEGSNRDGAAAEVGRTGHAGDAGMHMTTRGGACDRSAMRRAIGSFLSWPTNRCMRRCRRHTPAD